ncbi:MAG: ORF6N domain-containing protein [bacterium]
MFQLTKQELTNLKSQFVTFNPWWLRRAAPYAFIEQGVARFRIVFAAIKSLLMPEAKARKKVGFLLTPSGK